MMDIYLSRIFFVFLIITLAVWLRRTVCLLVTLKKTPRIKPAAAKSISPALVSVVIPAKNEGKNIRDCWQSLKAQTYPNLEIIVVNDNSTDETESILKSLGGAYVNCPPAPEGWTGKNHAIHCGVPKARGEWLLFTDADTRHNPEGIASAISYAEKNHLEFLSLLPHCLTGSFIEAVIQPFAMALLGLWFPLEKVNQPHTSEVFANGQYLLMKRSLYEKIGGHLAVRDQFLEDFALMNLTKKAGARAMTAFGTHLYGTRMYDSFSGIWKGWRRIYLHGFKSRPWPLLKNAFCVFIFSVIPFLTLIPACLSGSPILQGLNLALTGMIWIIASQAHQSVKANPLFAVFHPFAAAVLSLILLDAAHMALLNKKTFWR